MRIQRSANCAIVALSPTSGRIRSTISRPFSKRNAREGLAHVEGLAIAVEVAVIGGIEAGLAVEFAGQQPARKRHAGDDRDLLLPRQLENDSPGAAAEC